MILLSPKTDPTPFPECTTAVMLSIALARRPPPSVRSSVRVGCLIPFGFLALGCPSGADLENPDAWTESDCDPTTDFPSAPDSPVGLFEGACGGSICHSPSSSGAPPSGGTDLTSPGVAARLYDQAAIAGECASSGALLIDSSSPAQSLMLLKVHDQQPCGDGMPVPYTEASKLPNEDLACIESWVNRIAADGPGEASGSGGSSSGASDGGGSLGTGGGS